MLESIIVGITTLAITALGFAVGWGRMSEKIQASETRFSGVDRKLEDISTKLDNVHISSERMSVALWGIDQKNGLRGEVKEVKGMIHNMVDKIDELIQK